MKTTGRAPVPVPVTAPVGFRDSVEDNVPSVETCPSATLPSIFCMGTVGAELGFDFFSWKVISMGNIGRH